METTFDINKINFICNHLLDEQILTSSQMKTHKGLDSEGSEKITKLLSKELALISKILDLMSKIREIKMSFDNIDSDVVGKKKSFRSRS